MRFLLDENETPMLLPPLRSLYPMHTFDWSGYVFTEGMDDIPLIHAMARSSYDCLITKDGAQLTNDKERQALYENRIHWLGHKNAKIKGPAMLGQLVSTYSLALPHVLNILGSTNDTMAIHLYHQSRQPKDWIKPHRIDPLKRHFA